MNEKHTWKYDLQGNSIEDAKYNSDGSVKEKVAYKYDSQGNCIERPWYYFDDSLGGKILSKYDSQGNWIEEIKYEGDAMKPIEMTVREIVYRK